MLMIFLLMSRRSGDGSNIPSILDLISTSAEIKQTINEDSHTGDLSLLGNQF